MPSVAPPLRVPLYLGVNVAFILLMGVGCAVGGSTGSRLPYLVLLFALCSNPILDIVRLNGRLALMAMFMAVYFVSYGVVDLTNLFIGSPNDLRRDVLSETEAVIVAGGLSWVIGYRMAVHFVSNRPPKSAPRNWAKTTTLIVGSALWAIGTYAAYLWSVYIVPDTTNEALRKGIGSLSTLAVSANILGQMMQPFGLLLLAYVLYAFRLRFMLPVVIGVVLLQVALAFVVDIKGMAMLGGILVIVTCVMVTGRLPKAWLAAAVFFVIFVYPIFTAYRTAIHGDLGLARTAVIDNFAKVLRLSIVAEERVNNGRDRAQTFFERASVKGSTQMIVERTGAGVNFQYGHTLTPILAAFLPRIIWSDKPDVPTGQLVNKEFHLSESADVYISPSHLGELYWNFGWPGVILGMCLIGSMCGYIGARCDMSSTATVTRLLILVLTTKQLIVSFEGAIGSSYVLWLRSLAAIGVLHLLFSRVPVAALVKRPQKSADNHVPQVPSGDRRPFPNLMS